MDARASCHFLSLHATPTISPPASVTHFPLWWNVEVWILSLLYVLMQIVTKIHASGPHVDDDKIGKSVRVAARF
jgi:hypothetical protein